MPAPLTATARRRRLLALLALPLLLAGTLTACGSGDSSTPEAGARASAGSIELSDGRVPMPASPDVGVAYFTLANSGATDDELVGASSPDARSVMPMKDVTRGGSSTMVTVPKMVVPAHGETTLEPGGLHLMLEQLTRRLHVGDRVSLRLRFAHAGVLQVSIPVSPLTGSSDDPSDMGSMSGM